MVFEQVMWKWQCLKSLYVFSITRYFLSCGVRLARCPLGFLTTIGYNYISITPRHSTLCKRVNKRTLISMITIKNTFCFCGRGFCLSASQSSHLRSLSSHFIFTFCELHIFYLSIFTSYVFTPVSLLIPHFFTFTIFNFVSKI